MSLVRSRHWDIEQTSVRLHTWHVFESWHQVVLKHCYTALEAPKHQKSCRLPHYLALQAPMSITFSILLWTRNHRWGFGIFWAPLGKSSCKRSPICTQISTKTKQKKKTWKEPSFLKSWYIVHHGKTFTHCWTVLTSWDPIRSFLQRF